MASVTVTAPARTVRWREFWATGRYLAEPGWAIVNFDYYISSRHRPNYFSWNWVGNGGSFASSESVRASYSNAINLAGQYERYDLAAQLQQDMEYMLAVSGSVQSTQAALEIKIMRRAAGLFRGSRTVTVNPTVELLCVGTPAQIEAQIRNRFDR
ncbi:hypothetical protein IQ235_02730 [Oscillatoriales cyanobacterium LEGE 11467]|uniref:Uncharacterized protein n=1 Tax=Zarconia navalis LEGE 11467 TaxID=1828826 RepID=A0A928VXR3_9CYAN|nr:hypothetical protein [Zarconia navalis]MBE9039710.1 hypothetical protein [Zarconia navalis LEGE 11467]